MESRNWDNKVADASDKEKLREYGNSYYHKNKEKFRARREEWVDWFDDLKVGIGCTICGYNKCARALDFHHINKAEKMMSGRRLRFMYYGRQKYFDEFYKCALLCKNCHAEITYDTNIDDEPKSI